MRSRGIPDILIRWITSFLSQRRQRVVVQGCYSAWRPVLSGVPQGSVLGPLLFSLYVDDLDDVVSSGVHIKKFADDTKLYHSFTRDTATTASRSLQLSLNAVSDWCAQWQLPLNVHKCSVVHLGHTNPQTPYTMLGTALPSVERMRDLGMIVCNKFKVSAPASLG